MLRSGLTRNGAGELLDQVSAQTSDVRLTSLRREIHSWESRGGRLDRLLPKKKNYPVKISLRASDCATRSGIMYDRVTVKEKDRPSIWGL